MPYTSTTPLLGKTYKQAVVRYAYAIIAKEEEEARRVANARYAAL